MVREETNINVLFLLTWLEFCKAMEGSSKFYKFLGNLMRNIIVVFCSFLPKFFMVFSLSKSRLASGKV